MEDNTLQKNLDFIASGVVAAAADVEAELDNEIERLDALEVDDLVELRRKRLEQMKDDSRRRSAALAAGHGEYMMIEEKDFFKVTKESNLIVAHFWRPSTWRCEIFDKHIRALVGKHWKTRFVKLNAEQCPYLTERLHIWCLPSLVLCKDGKTDHTVVGFSEFRKGDDVQEQEFEELLAKWGMVELD